MLDKFHIRKSAQGTKNEDYISSGIRDYDNFSKSNMAAVAIFDFWENCSFGIYDTMLDVFLGVENIGVDSKSKCLSWPTSEI